MAIKKKGTKNVIKFAKGTEMILKFDRSYSKRHWELHASVLQFMSTVKYEYTTEKSQELNKYAQSVITRRLRDCYVITNQRRWFQHEQKGCVSDKN